MKYFLHTVMLILMILLSAMFIFFFFPYTKELSSGKITLMIITAVLILTCIICSTILECKQIKFQKDKIDKIEAFKVEMVNKILHSNTSGKNLIEIKKLESEIFKTFCNTLIEI